MKKICLILEYYHFLGRKWTYPILFHMNCRKKYTFDDFIYITHRKISRSILLLFLERAIELSIIKKEDKRYRLTRLGTELKKEFMKIREILLEHNKYACKDCDEKSLINKIRESLV